MPEIVSQIHRLFIVNHVNCLCLTTELSEPRAAGLSRIFCFPDFVSTCLQELVIRNSFCSCTFEFKDVSSHFDFQAVQKTSVSSFHHDSPISHFLPFTFTIVHESSPKSFHHFHDFISRVQVAETFRCCRAALVPLSSELLLKLQQSARNF